MKDRTYFERYIDLASDHEELCRDFEHLHEEFQQQEEILDSIECVLRKHLSEEQARTIYQEIFQIG